VTLTVTHVAASIPPLYGAVTFTGDLITMLDALGRPVTSATTDASGTAALV